MPYVPDPRYAPDPRYGRVDRRYAPDPRFRVGQPPIGVPDPTPTDPLSEIRKKAAEYGLSAMIERNAAIRRAEATRKAEEESKAANSVPPTNSPTLDELIRRWRFFPNA